MLDHLHYLLLLSLELLAKSFFCVIQDLDIHFSSIADQQWLSVFRSYNW